MTDKTATSELLKQYGATLRTKTENILLASQQHPDDNKTPLLQRVAKLLAAMSDEEKTAGIELAELQYRLKGRKGGRAHVGEIAECLRKLGYERRRGWREGRTGFCSRWHPQTL